MKIFTNGARHWGGQVNRIEEGFKALGHEITPYVTEADLVYSNNDHKQIICDKNNGSLKSGAKVILTCLDVPTHIPGFDVIGLAKELANADAVCSISKFGQWQTKKWLNIDSHLIYQPIKPVEYLPGAKQIPFYRFIHCGRRTDPNKRFQIGVNALALLGFKPKDLALIGNEPGWGDYLGVLNDHHLNVAYNSADFVLATSYLEGLCLPVLEAMATGAIPVVCLDMTTREELLPPNLFPEYNEVTHTPIGVARFIAQFMQDDGPEKIEKMKTRLRAHYKENWEYKTSPKGVAEAILKVYEQIA